VGFSQKSEGSLRLSVLADTSLLPGIEGWTSARPH
jgi:hypothetical protein